MTNKLIRGLKFTAGTIIPYSLASSFAGVGALMVYSGIKEGNYDVANAGIPGITAGLAITLATIMGKSAARIKKLEKESIELEKRKENIASQLQTQLADDKDRMYWHSVKNKVIDATLAEGRGAEYLIIRDRYATIRDASEAFKGRINQEISLDCTQTQEGDSYFRIIADEITPQASKELEKMGYRVYRRA